MVLVTPGLPSLKALVAFEAVARHLSFTAAGRELGVSQAATSQQIKLLEAELRLTLVRRSRPIIGLTPEGEVLATALRDGLETIADALRRIRPQDRGQRLTVATSVAFSSFWLMPRLPGFHAERPTAELRLVASDAIIDWQGEAIDLAIVFGHGPWPGFVSLRLFGDEIQAVAKRDVAASHAALLSPAALLDGPLLQLETDNPDWVVWQAWLEHFGVEMPKSLPGLRFNSYIHMVQAALDGQGILLGWRRLVEPLLQSGALRAVSAERMVPEAAYHLLVPEALTRRPVVRAFRNWVSAAAAEDW